MQKKHKLLLLNLSLRHAHILFIFFPLNQLVELFLCLVIRFENNTLGNWRRWMSKKKFTTYKIDLVCAEISNIWGMIIYNSFQSNKTNKSLVNIEQTQMFYHWFVYRYIDLEYFSNFLQKKHNNILMYRCHTYNIFFEVCK